MREQLMSQEAVEPEPDDNKETSTDTVCPAGGEGLLFDLISRPTEPTGEAAAAPPHVPGASGAASSSRGPDAEPREHAEIVHIVPNGGKLVFYRKSTAIFAMCPNKKHKACRMSITKNKRPLGLLSYYLSIAFSEKDPEKDTADNHSKAARASSPETRLKARLELSHQAGSANIFKCERDRDIGEPEEPHGLAADSMGPME